MAGFRFWVAVLVMLFAVFSGFALAADDESSDPAHGSALSAPPEEPQGPELLGKRTATSKTFALPGGSRESRIYETPIHYENAEGEWKPIEEALEPLNGTALTNGANSFDLTLPTRLGAGPVKLSDDGRWVAVQLLDAPTDTAELRAGDEVVSYEADDGTTFELTSLPTGVKEEIELTDPSDPSTFHFELSASAGVDPAEAPDGSIEFRDQHDELVAILPAPTIADSSGLPGPIDAVSYVLERSDGEWRLAVKADREWLQDPARQWPVRIDPTITVPSPALDCVIASALPTSGLCASGLWKTIGANAIYQSGGATALSRSLLRFNVGAIPSNASVNAATIGLYSPTSAKNTSGVGMFRATKPWTSSVSWNKYDGISSWAYPGGDISLSEGGYVTTAARGSQLGWWQFSEGIRGLVQRWVSGAVANEGVLVGLKDESPWTSGVERKVEFNSSTATSDKPYLSATYYLPAPASSKVASPTDGTVTARRIKLKAAWTEPGVTGVSFQAKQSGDQSFDAIPAELVKDAQGQAVSWPVAVSGVKQTEPLYFDAANFKSQFWAIGGKVEIRAIFEGPQGVAGYSAPVTATVDRNAGSPRDAVADVGPGTVNLLTGDLSVSRTDTSIPAFGSALEFSRTYNSREPGQPWDGGVLGPGWKPGVPVEAAGGGAWRNIKDVTISEEIEGESYTFAYALITDAEGSQFAFDKENGFYVTPPDAPGWSLTTEEGGTKLVLAEPSGTRTTFENSSGGNEYLPVAVSSLGGEGNRTRMVYQVVSGNRRLSKVIAPSHEDAPCPEATATSTEGCRVLTFTYAAATTWGGQPFFGDRLQKITYHAPGNGGPWDVAEYKYNAEGRLIEAWDPRISPALVERYSYEASGQLKTLTPAGQEPWTLEYGTYGAELANSRLVRIKRPSLLASPSVAQTTIAYEVPTSGSGAPYDMSASAVAQWGQQNLPVDATAIFPPDQIPSNPPSSYSRATVYYMEAEGRLVNTATPSGAGTTAASITTSESDEFGNVVRELTPQNRLRALAAGSGSVARSHELETKRQYSADGTELQEEWGPLHQVRLESGAATQARLHRTIQYDASWPGTGLKPHLPTRETAGASIPGLGVDADQRVTESTYDWLLRKLTQTIVDPSGLNLRTTTVYDPISGLPVEVRQPSEPSGGGAGTRKVLYYENKGSTPADCKSKKWAGLPCKVLPAAQPGAAGQPELLIRHIKSYNALGQPTELTEIPGGGAEWGRKTLATFDAAGRQLTIKQEGGGASIPKVEILYSSTSGLPTAQRFKCEPACEDDQAIATTYDALGRVTKYQDADGNTATTTYDLLGRPVTTGDGKGTQTRIYDANSGLLTELQDSAAGTFTANYDADGNLVERVLPNGLLAKTTYNEAGEPVQRSYAKATTWLDFGTERSIHGQVLAQAGTLSSQQYTYDKAGRLTLVKDTPQGGSCTTREYKFEGDPGKNSNRTKLITRAPGIGGACDTTSAGTTQSYTYDKADRLLGTGLTYDNFGRITSLPGSYAGEGKALATSYFSNDMVASQSQGGITNIFQLDGALRQRQRIQGGGLEGTEIFHYADASDSPAWTERAGIWSRNIVGIGGELAAIQDSGTGVSLQLTNLHGDVVAKASLSPSATGPTATFESDEFGNSKGSGPGRFGWLGGKQRRTELPSGVIQMGARSYVPALGRFLTPDPILGGSANAYEYAGGDPVNNFDLTGEKCVGPKSWVPNCKRMKAEAAARRANKRGAIMMQFKSQRGAEIFLRYLQSNPLYTENIRKKEAQWKAAEMREIQHRAARVAAETPYHRGAKVCGWVSWGTGVAGLALAPVSGGASFIVGILGAGTGLGDLTDLC